MSKLSRAIISTGVFRTVKTKTESINFPGGKGFTVYQVVANFKSHTKWQNFLERAAAISYNTIMALPPSLLFLFTTIPLLPFIKKNSLKAQFHELIYDIIPAKVHNKDIIDFIDKLIDNAKVGLLSFGLILTLFFASNAIMGLMRSFDRGYKGFKERKGLAKRGVALKITLINFALLVTYIFLLIFQGRILNALVENRTWRSIIYYSRWGLIVLLVYFSIAVLYRYGPSIQKKWSLLSPGAVLGTLLSLFSSIGFAIFVNNFGKYNALYGAIGTLMMLMALIFINSLAVLIGFEVNASINRLEAEQEERILPKTSDQAS